MNMTIEGLCKTENTAFYVFDAKTLCQRIAYLRSVLPRETSLCYAVKANTFITKEIKDEVDSFEICSPGEAYICKDLGIPSSMMVISGVYKTPSFIESLVADPEFAGIITIESLTQYRLLCVLSVKYDKRIDVLLRLTNASQFGMDEEDADEIIGRRGDNPLINIVGIQFGQKTEKRDRVS